MPSCNQVGCKIASGGPCLEGQGEKCPHYRSDQEVAENLPQDIEPQEIKIPVSSLYDGLKLPQSESTKYVLSGNAKVVAIVGPKDCGKTTLLARIHEYFHNGPVAGYGFTGSKTLMAFGLVSWNAMRASGRTKPDTERSKKIEADLYLHLHLKQVEDLESTHLLLYDIPGEIFNEAASHHPTIARMHGVGRADHLVLCLDGKALLDPSQRIVQIRNARDFLKMAVQSKQIGKNTLLNIVITKIDALTAAQNELLEFARKKRDEIVSEFKASLGLIRTWEISARPDGDFLETTDTIERLFVSWVKETRRNMLIEPAPKACRIIGRDFCRFGLNESI